MSKDLKLITTEDKNGNKIIAVKGNKPRLSNMKEFINSLTDSEIKEVDKVLIEWVKMTKK